MKLEIKWRFLNLKTTYELTETSVFGIYKDSVLNSSGWVSPIYILRML